ACAISPAGRQVVSASQDRTLKAWDLDTGAEQRTLAGGTATMCAGAVTAAGPRAAGESQGHLHTAGLVGLEAGPLVVTATDLGSGLQLRCPVCLQYVAFQDQWLGQVIDCPIEGCAARLQVNPFVVVGRTPPSRRPWWQWWRR